MKNGESLPLLPPGMLKKKLRYSSIQNLPNYVTTSTKEKYDEYIEGYTNWRQGDPEGVEDINPVETGFTQKPGDKPRAKPRAMTEFLNFDPVEFRNPYLLDFVGSSGTMSLSQVVRTLVISVLGASPVIMPMSFSSAGYLGGSLCLLVIGLLIGALGARLSDALDLAEKGGPLITRLQDLAELAFGPSAKIVFLVSTTGALAGFFCTLAGLQAKQIASVLGDIGLTNAFPFVLLGLYPIYLLLTNLLTDPNQLNKLTMMATGLIGTCISLLFFLPILRIYTGPSASHEFQAFHFERSLVDIIFSYSDFLVAGVFSFAVVVTFPSVRSNMLNPSDFPKALSIALLIVLSLYLCLFTLLYYAYGSEIKPSILDTVRTDSPNIGLLCSVCYVSYCLLTTIFFVIIAVKGLEGFFPALAAPTNRLIFLALYLSILLLIVYVIPDINVIIKIIASLFCVMNNILVPALAFLLLSPRKIFRISSIPLPNIRVMDYLIICVSLLVGALVFILGEYSGITQFMETLSKSRDTDV